MTDTQIIEYLRNDQHAAAIKQLYGVLPSAKKYVVANSGSEEDAKDVFQDALVVLHRKTKESQWVLTSSLKTYLLAIVKNCWQSELRHRMKMSAAGLPAEVADSITDEEEYFIKAKIAFRMLGEKCRQLLTQFYFDKKSFRKIAASLDFGDEKTAKNQKYRCLQKAKENYTSLSK